MYVIVCSIKPEKGLIELFVITEDRQITAVWMPRKYAKRARIEKIIRGKALDREQFIALATAIPAIVSTSTEVDGFRADPEHDCRGVETKPPREA